MSEVGTKLDLARAYMDMGDPDGARSILDEVLQEGNATQKQEAAAPDRACPDRRIGAAMSRIAVGLEYDGTRLLRLAVAGARADRAGESCKRALAQRRRSPCEVVRRPAAPMPACTRSHRSSHFDTQAVRTERALGAWRQHQSAGDVQRALGARRCRTHFHARYSALARTYRY